MGNPNPQHIPGLNILWGEEAQLATASADTTDPHQAFQEGNLEVAEQLARARVNADLTDVESMELLAKIALARKDSLAAIEWYQRATNTNPSDVHLWLRFGKTAVEAKNTAQATRAMDMALSLDAESSEVHLAMGDVQRQMLKFPEAIHHYRKASDYSPKNPEPQIRLAEIYFQQHDLDSSMGAAQKALKISSRSARAYTIYGRGLAKIGQTKEALSAFRAAIKLEPQYADAYAYTAQVSLELGQTAQGLEAAIQAVQIQADHTSALVFRAAALRLLGHIDEAMVACHKAILTHAKLSEVHTVLGTVYMDCGLPDEAAKSFERGLGLDPTLRGAHSELVVCRAYSPKKTLSDVHEEIEKWAEAYGTPIYDRPKKAEQIKRIGFVSPNLNDHPYGRYVLELARGLEKQGIEVYFYAFGAEDEVSKQIQEHGMWRCVTGLDDETAAVIIAEDNIDVLVDVCGHLEGNRIGIFLQRPCGIQVTWLGHLAPTGSSAFDAVIGDDQMTTPNTTGVSRMHGPMVCFQPPVGDYETSRLREDGDDGFTFGAICSSRQVNRLTVQTWAEILKMTPNSRLLLKARGLHSTAIRKQFLNWFETHGIEKERIVCLGNTSRVTHLETYRKVDLCLDPFPWSGMNATLEAAYMGLPTVTWMGHATWRRGAGAVMKNLGLDEYVANDIESYVNQARKLASQPESLGHIRNQLRSWLLDSEYCDQERFAKSFLAALHQVD